MYNGRSFVEKVKNLKTRQTGAVGPDSLAPKVSFKILTFRCIDFDNFKNVAFNKFFTYLFLTAHQSLSELASLWEC